VKAEKSHAHDLLRLVPDKAEESRTTRVVTCQETSYSKPAFNGFQTVMVNRFEGVKGGWHE
jgi:hypothetical protein